MPLLPHRLNTRIILIVSCILLVTGVTSGWVTARHQTASLLTTMRLNSSIMVRNFAESAAHQLLVQDYAVLETFLLKSAELSEIRRLQICEPDGTLIWDVTRGRNGQPQAKTGIAHITPPVSRSAVVVTDNDRLVIWQPIMAGSLLGWLKADFSLSAIKEAQTRIWEHTLLLTLTWVACSALLIILVLRPIVQSISKLSAFAKRLDKQKGAQITVTGQPHEITELGASLNEASAQLFATEQQILKERERLQKSEANYRQLLDTIQEGIWVIDANAVTTFVNPRMADILGYTTDEMIGRHLYSFMDEQGKLIAENNIERRKRGIREQHDFEFIRKDGQRIHTRLEASPIIDDAGNYTGSIAAVADISERRRAEAELRKLYDALEQRVAERTVDLDMRSAELSESQQALMNIVEDLNEKTVELEQANARLKEVDRLKSMFIASMSHELRTPLNSIIGFSSILHDEWLGQVNAEQKENLAIILRCGKHLLSLINDVIDVSKIEAGRIEVLPQEFDLYDLMQEGITFVAKDIKDKGLDLRLENIHLQIFTDRQRLLQCVLNLLSNAMKFTEKGSISVETQLVQGAGRGVEESEVEISVTDTGVGIRGEDLPKMFQPFVRLTSPLQATVPGTGLGLYLTRKLADEVLKGDILLSSEYGKGSRFTIRIPVRTT